MGCIELEWPHLLLPGGRSGGGGGGWWGGGELIRRLVIRIGRPEYRMGHWNTGTPSPQLNHLASS